MIQKRTSFPQNFVFYSYTFKNSRRDTTKEIQENFFLLFLPPLKFKKPERKEKQLFWVMNDYQFC